MSTGKTASDGGARPTQGAAELGRTRTPQRSKWTTPVDDSPAASAFTRPLIHEPHGPWREGRRGSAGAATDEIPGIARTWGPARFMAKMVESAAQLGEHRMALMLLSVLTVATGLLCAVSSPSVFYGNYLFATWKSHLKGGTPEESGVVMPALPAQIIALEHAMAWCAIGGTLVGFAGIAAARTRRKPAILCLHFAVALAFAIACLGVVGYASFHQYLMFGEDQLTTSLDDLWKSLIGLKSKKGHDALCEMQQSFQCTGFRLCCLTNTNDYDECVLDSGLVNSECEAWKSMCFLSLPNGTMVDRSGADVTSSAESQCAHMIPVAGASPLCPAEPGIAPDDLKDFMSPCHEKLVGSLTTSLGFTLCSIFAMAVFSFVGMAYTCVIWHDGPRRRGGRGGVSHGASAVVTDQLDEALVED